jgi:hypothetical protein
MREQTITVGEQPSPWLFFTLAFVLSWLFWVPAAIMSQSTDLTPPGILFLLGGFGPSAAGVIMI